MTFQQKQAQSRAGQHQAALVHVETEGRGCEVWRAGAQLPPGRRDSVLQANRQSGSGGPQVLVRGMACLPWAGRPPESFHQETYF